MAEQPLVLLASAEDWLARSLESVFTNAGYRVVQADTEQETLRLAHRQRPDAIFLDLDFGTSDGLSLCRDLRADPAVALATPITLLKMGHASRSELLEALRAGAWDLRGQPLDAEEMLLRLGACVQGKLEVDRLGTHGLVDAASGLYNAVGIERRAEELASLTMRQSLPLSCVVFKPANGAAPDDWARSFKTYGRISDAIGRTAPDECTVFAPATDALAAQMLIRRMTKAVGPLRSGYSAASPTPGAARVSPQELLTRARTALGGAAGAA